MVMARAAGLPVLESGRGSHEGLERPLQLSLGSPVCSVPAFSQDLGCSLLCGHPQGPLVLMASVLTHNRNQTQSPAAPEPPPQAVPMWSLQTETQWGLDPAVSLGSPRGVPLGFYHCHGHD